MKKLSIPVSKFDLSRFVQTIVAFWNDPEVAFPFVKNGSADFGTMSLDDDEDLGDDPLEWLQHGHTLFAQLFSGDGCTYNCADGTEIEVPEEDDELIDKTYLDDCSTYGFLIQVKKDTVTLRAA